MIRSRDVRELQKAVAAFARAVQPDAVPLPDALPIWEAFDAIERHAAAVKTLLARRVEESLAWQRAGYRSAEEFLAKRAGRSTAASREQLETSKKLQDLPATEQAMRDGRLSEQQAEVIADAAHANRGAEQQLIEHAKRSSFKELRDEAARARAGADPDPAATERRIHRQRRLRTWTDSEGGWNLSARGTVRDGSRVMHALEPVIDELFRNAQSERQREERDAYAFDALVKLADKCGAEPAKRPNPRYLALLRLDSEALQRGEVHDGELCEITGLGPVPVTTARELLGEAILKLVVTKGVDVLNVTHLGRGPSAAQRVALLWRSPGCTVEGCARTRVEIDHREPWRETHHTRLDETDPFCGHHHRLKHREGWALIAGAGKRPMVPPDDPRHPKNRPKQDAS